MSIRVGYKMTEIGEIPEDWEVRRLSDVSAIVMGQSPKGISYNKNGQGLPLLNGAADFKGNKIKPRQFTSHPTKVSSKGDLIFCIRATIGNIAIADQQYCLGRGVAALRTKDLVDKNFLIQVLQTKFERLASISAGSVIKGIKKDDLERLTIAMPHLLEQQKIGSILSTVDKAIEKTDAVIGKVKMLKRGLMQRLLTQGIGHTAFKQTEIGEIPEEWAVVRLGDCIEYGPQNGIYKHMSLYGRGSQIVRIDDFYDGFFIRTSGFERVDLSNDEISTYQLKAREILVNRVNSLPYLGKSAIVPSLAEPTVFESNMMRLRINSKRLLSEFAIRWLCTSYAKRHFQKRAKRAVAQASINQKDVCALRIATPPIDEQEKIVSILSAIDEKIEMNRERKDHLRKLKKGLMQDLLIGRVRVKVT